MSYAIPEIALNNYRLGATCQFIAEASPEAVARYYRDLIGKGGFMIWDPENDADGFMICLPTVAQLNAAFLDHFGDDIARQTP